MRILTEIVGGVVLLTIFAYGVQYIIRNINIFIKEKPSAPNVSERGDVSEPNGKPH